MFSQPPERLFGGVQNEALCLALAETRPAGAALAAMPAGSHPLMRQVSDAIEKRARALLSGLADDDGAEPEPPPKAKAAPGKNRKLSKPKAARSS